MNMTPLSEFNKSNINDIEMTNDCDKVFFIAIEFIKNDTGLYEALIQHNFLI